MNFRLLLAFLFFANNMFAKNPESLFLKANNAYSENEFETAIHLYDSILDKEFISAELYYNLGNSHFKMQNLGLAILYFEKAIKIDPKNQDIKHNLEFCNNLILDKYKAQTINPITEVLYQNQSPNRYALIASALFFITILLAFIYIFKSFNSKIFFSLFTLLFTIGTIFSILGYQQHKFNTNNTFGIITSTIVNVKSEPNLSAKKSFILHEGSKIELLESNNEWTKINFDSDKIGWIQNVNFKAI